MPPPLDDSSNHSSGHSESASSKNNVDSDSASGTSGSASGHSSTSPSTSTGRSASGRGGLPEEIIATKETKAVWQAKILVLTVLLIAAGVAGFMTYWLTDSSEQDDFETQVSKMNDFVLLCL